MGLSLVPDVDAVPGLVAGDIRFFHNAAMSSLAAALIVSLIAAGVFSWKYRFSLLFGFAVAFVSYATHLLMDFFTAGRGVMLLWPFVTERFVSPVKLFYGLHYSDGLLSPRHLWTVLTEMMFVIGLLLALRLVMPDRRNARGRLAVTAGFANRHKP